MIPIDHPSASTQMVRVCLPSTFMTPDIAAIHRKARRLSPQMKRGDREARGENAMPIDYEAEYNNRARVPEHPEIFARWAREAEDYRAEAMKERRAELGLSYGASLRQFIDLFSARQGVMGPLALFIHGGYWRSLDPSLFSHMARGLNAHDVTVAVVGYDLCPEVTIAAIIEQIRHACLFLWLRTGQRMMIYGHSAGGHLAGAMVATDWQALYPKAPPDLVPAAYSISGLFDLKPLVGVPMAQDLRLDEAEARRVSPCSGRRRKGAPSTPLQAPSNQASSCARVAPSPSNGARPARKPATRRSPEQIISPSSMDWPIRKMPWSPGSPSWRRKENNRLL